MIIIQNRIVGSRWPASSSCTKDYFLNAVLGKLEQKTSGNCEDSEEGQENWYYPITLEHLYIGIDKFK